MPNKPMSPQIGQFIDLAISYTQKFLGASDVPQEEPRLVGPDQGVRPHKGTLCLW